MIIVRWFEVCIHTTNEAVEPVSNIFNEAGANGVVIVDPADLTRDRIVNFGEIYALNPKHFPKEGVYIKAYFPDDSKFDEKLKMIELAINNLDQFGISLGRNEVTVNDVAEADWSTAWKKYYKPTKVSDRVTIVPEWETYKPESCEELVAKLNPGMAFGTGTHQTTKLSIQGLEKYLKQDDLVIDVGCGSGILSIVSILLGAKKVYAYDLDKVAVKSTKVNSELNHVNDKIHINENNLLEGVRLQADVIVSNILAEIIMKFIEDAWNNLKDNGIFITSGIIDSKEQDVKRALEKQGFVIIETNKQDHWVSLIAKKLIE